MPEIYEIKGHIFGRIIAIFSQEINFVSSFLTKLPKFRNKSANSLNKFKNLSLSSLGGMLETYDFLIFVFFIQYISKAFFPSYLGDFWRDLAAYGLFAAGYILRPFGGVILAHFGDKFGRKSVFILSLILMVIPIFVISVLPTFESIGYAAPIIMLIMRMMQGISFGGELPQAWVFVYEHSDPKQKGFFLGFISAATIFGTLFATVVTLVIHQSFEVSSIQDFAWRVPFLLGTIFGVSSIYLRRFLNETPVFQEMKKHNKTGKFPLKDLLKAPKTSFVMAFFISIAMTGIVLVMQLFLPNFMQASLGFSKIQASYMQLFGLICLIAGNLIVGNLADKFGVSKVAMIFAVLLAISSFGVFAQIYLYKNISLLVFLYFIAEISAGIMTFAPLIMCDVFKAKYRLSAISLIYNVSYAISGSLSPQAIFALHSLALGGGMLFLGIYGYMFVICALVFASGLIYKWQKY
ncbi:MAG: MFS transporter [Helicobacter sp.]|nr:MFS transporter [Helicobacter sp.]